MPITHTPKTRGQFRTIKRRLFDAIIELDMREREAISISDSILAMAIFDKRQDLLNRLAVVGHAERAFLKSKASFASVVEALDHSILQMASELKRMKKHNTVLAAASKLIDLVSRLVDVVSTGMDVEDRGNSVLSPVRTSRRLCG
ncbi:MAG: hypothetical protein ACWA47_11790 [Brevirhabdus sp.]